MRLTIRLILKGDAVQIGEDEFYNPWRTVDIDVPDDLIDIKHEHIVGAVARNDGKRSRCIWCDSPYRIEYNWIDREGNTASFADEDRHLVATGIANYCPNCGAKMKGVER